MATNPLLALFAQAMMAVPFMLPFLFAGLFCGVYILLIVVNTVFALVDGFRRRPSRLLVARKAMLIISSLVAVLICIWFLFNIDGRFT